MQVSCSDKTLSTSTRSSVFILFLFFGPYTLLCPARHRSDFTAFSTGPGREASAEPGAYAPPFDNLFLVLLHTQELALRYKFFSFTSAHLSFAVKQQEISHRNIKKAKEHKPPCFARTYFNVNNWNSQVFRRIPYTLSFQH